jgi:hypothetical protein
MAIFDKKMGVVWPLIIDQRLIHLTPHMFPCHRSHSWVLVETISWAKIRSHSWIYGGDHFLGKNPYVLTFGIIENVHSWLFSTKNGGYVAIDLRPEARTPHPTYASFP